MISFVTIEFKILSAFGKSLKRSLCQNIRTTLVTMLVLNILRLLKAVEGFRLAARDRSTIWNCCLIAGFVARSKGSKLRVFTYAYPVSAQSC